MSRLTDTVRHSKVLQGGVGQKGAEPGGGWCGEGRGWSRGGGGGRLMATAY